MNLHRITAEPEPAPKGRFDKLRESIDGPEKYCTRCSEWWPADLEFFYADPTGVACLFYCCKACYREWKSGATKKAQALA